MEMSTAKFEHDYDLGSLQIITPQKWDFKMLATPRCAGNLCREAHEEFTSNLLLNMSTSKMLFIDIGAHYGYYTLLVGTSHPNSKIVAFEPVPSNFEILKRNVALNELKNVECHNVAVSNNNELKQLQITEASDTCGFYGHPSSATINRIDVRTVRLDDLLASPQESSIIVKMDAEGHEPRIRIRSDTRCLHAGCGHSFRCTAAGKADLVLAF